MLVVFTLIISSTFLRWIKVCSIGKFGASTRISLSKRAHLSRSVSESSDCGNNSKSERCQLGGTSLLNTLTSVVLFLALWAGGCDSRGALTIFVPGLALWALG